MKIAYILNWDLSLKDGVSKKVLSQINEWEIKGVEVHVFYFSKGKSIIRNGTTFRRKNGLSDRILINDNLYDTLKEFNPDLVYLRYDTWTMTIHKIIKEYRTIVELNTLDVYENWVLFKKNATLKLFIRYFFNILFRNILFKNIVGFVSVTYEIAKDKTILKYNLDNKVVPNSIDLNSYSILKDLFILKNEERIGLFFIGTPNQPWHGVDIIENMAKKMPEYDFHIVGMEGNSTQNLFWHGYLQKDKYIRILKKCHFCIGTLALYRNGMQEACPLKVREYLAYGYPIIIGYEETAFIDNKNKPDYLLQIDTEKGFDIKTINKMKDFIEKNKFLIVKHSDINDLIGSSSLETKRLSFFKSKIVSH